MKLADSSKILLKPRTAILIFFALALIMFSSATIELRQSRKEQLHLMEENGKALLETVVSSARKALLTYDYLEIFLEEKLLNNAMFLRHLLQQHSINNQFLNQFARQFDVYRIRIFSPDGKLLYTSHPIDRDKQAIESEARESLAPIFNDESDTLIIGYHQSKISGEMRYVVALATPQNGAIVVVLDAQDLLEFRKKVGFGSLLRALGNNPGIRYCVLQDSSGIIAASGSVRMLERVVDSPFLSKAARDTLFHAREYPLGNEMVYEAVQSFYLDNLFVGIFRLGISMEPLNRLKARLIRRIIIISIVLLVIGSIIMTLIFIRQNYAILERQYQIVETYSSDIIRNVSDGIIVIDNHQKIKIWNHAAEDIFQLKAEQVMNKTITDVLSAENCQKILDSPQKIKEIDCQIGDKAVSLLVSGSQFRDEQNQRNLIIVIRDLTDLRQMQEQIRRQERMSAMGELASGVAHEIRNPLNSISTIAQQLKKDFTPKQNSEEYNLLTEIVIKEVERINKTVDDFLKFARPQPLHPEMFSLTEFWQNLTKQFQSLLAEKNIRLKLESSYQGEVFWDRMQMQQVFINLLQNSIEAIGKEGEIKIRADKKGEAELEISFEDNGPGIKKELRDKIFNLYFTTKARGTGIGLSIVQRIIFEHGGRIRVDEAKSGGAKFIIHLPLKAIEKIN